MFHIAVCVKSVLLEGQARGTESVERTEANSGMNPFDLLALECALSLGREGERRISVFSMGAQGPGEMVLREAARLGVDELFLLCDPMFGGADTYATAKVLNRALRQTGPFDLILCGERAVDGETGQVPGELAAMLEIPYVTAVEELEQPSPQTMTGVCRTAEGYARFQTPCPAVLGISCGMRHVGHPVIPSLAQLRKAAALTIRRLDGASLGLLPEEVGRKGSLTRVVDAQRPDWDRTCRLLEDVEEGAALVKELARTVRRR